MGVAIAQRLGLMLKKVRLAEPERWGLEQNQFLRGGRLVF